MTLITRLSTAFTDTTLPVLRKDPALPSDSLTSGGDRALFDWKNPGCYPSQSSSLNGNPFDSLAYPSVGPITYGGGQTQTYDAATGSINVQDLFIEDGPDKIFSDTTADYVISFWVRYNSTPSNGFPMAIKEANFGYPGTLHFRYTNAPEFYVQENGNFSSANRVTFSAITLNTPTRYGVHWTKSSGVWRLRGVTNNGTPTSYTNMTVGSGANGIAPTDGSLDRMKLMGKAAISWQRFYVENLTVSGRTAEQVWDADWARGNGRYS